MGNTKRLESEETDLKFRGDCLVYLRTIDRQMQNEMGGQNRRGGAESYDHTREPKKGGGYNGKWEMVYAEHAKIEIIDMTSA